MFESAEKVSFTVGRVEAFKCPADKAQAFLWSSDVKGLGVRATPRGKPSYIWQGHLYSKVIRVTIGPAAEMSPLAASKIAKAFTGDVARGIDPRIHRQESKRVSQEAAVAKAAEAVQSQYSLGRLCETYAAHLAQQGKSSARDIARMFASHIPKKFALLPASKVTEDDVIVILRKAAASGHRTSNKVLTALRAAYRLCLVKSAAEAGNTAFDAFGIKTSPLANIQPLASGNNADLNPFSLREMRLHWYGCQHVTGHYGSFLRLHVLLGGPRLAQLAGLKVSDIKGRYLELTDRKGRGGIARRYALPITPEIKRELDAMSLGKAAGDLLWSSPKGGPIDRTCLSDWGQRANAIVEIDGFQLKRVRSGVETILGAVGVSKDTRKELQSHALHGVQKRHYDANEYLPEKLEALQALHPP